MTINFRQIQASRRTPGVETEVNDRGALQGVAPNRQKIMLVGQRMNANISTPSMVPATVTGANNCTIDGTAAFTGSVLRKFIIEISTEATPDTFKWSKDNGATWTTGVNCAVTPITLAEGVVITFGLATGHKVGDRWTFVAFPAGTVAQKIPTQCLSAGDAAANFGRGSVLHRAVMVCIETAEQYGNVDINCTALDDASGTPAAGSITITGPATAAGSIKIWIGGDSFEVAYSKDATAAAIALLLKGELDKDAGLDLAYMIHRDSANLAKIVFTAKNDGTANMDATIAAEYTSNTGVGATIVQMANGATDPANVADGLDAFQGEKYGIIGLALNDAANLALLTAQIDVLNGPTEKKFATGYFGMNGTTLATITTRASGVNHWATVCTWFKGSYSPGYEIMAAFCALKAFVENATQPLNDMQLFGLHIPSVANRITGTEIETCLNNGVSPLKVDSQSRAAVVRSVTTDIDHEYYVDIQVACGLHRFMSSCDARFQSVFAGAKNLGLETRDAVVDEALFVAHELEKAPEEVLRNVSAYEDQFIAEEMDGDPSRINISCPSPIVPGLHRICARFDLIWGG